MPQKPPVGKVWLCFGSNVLSLSTHHVWSLWQDAGRGPSWSIDQCPSGIYRFHEGQQSLGNSGEDSSCKNFAVEDVGQQPSLQPLHWSAVQLLYSDAYVELCPQLTCVQFVWLWTLLIDYFYILWGVTGNCECWCSVGLSPKKWAWGIFSSCVC